MKGFLEWFKSSTKMKRWIFLILIGIILTCYGIAEILVLKELSFSELAKIIAIFVIGFTIIVIGIIFSSKRILEVLIENTDARIERARKSKDINIKSLIFNKKVYEEGPNIVVIGGGNGLNTVLRGLKQYTNNITAIVTVSDYGKTPTNSRKELELMPLEDIKSSIIALSYDEVTMEMLLNSEIKNSKLKGLSFGDIYLLTMKELYGNITEYIEKSANVLNMTGRVLPVTLDEMKICAELKDGTIIEEKDKIPEVVYDKVSTINRIYINPSNCVPAPRSFGSYYKCRCNNYRTRKFIYKCNTKSVNKKCFKNNKDK